MHIRWLDPTPWDVAQKEREQQETFAATVANAIVNGGAPKVNDDNRILP